MSTRNNQMDDPRNSALETPFVLPKTWHRGANGSSYLFGHLWMVVNVFFFSSLTYLIVQTVYRRSWLIWHVSFGAYHGDS